MTIDQSKVVFDTKKKNLMLHHGDYYFPINKTYKRLPLITGLPEIKFQKYSVYTGRTPLTRKPAIGMLKTPKNCSIYRIVNYPTKKWGSPQISVLGNYGEGKSNFLNLIIACYMAKKHNLLMFDDSSFEIRSLAMHGFYIKGIFHPFIINIFVPRGYEFDTKAKNWNPMWEARKNVHLRYFDHPFDIIDALKPHEISVVFTEAFDQASVLRLWIDLMRILRKQVTYNTSYIFVHHEFATMFPESSRREIYKLIEDAVAIVKRFRKDRIGILTSFHESSDVTYKISRKFGFVCQKKPVNKKERTPVEDAARNYSKNQINISIGGYWRKHLIGMFPEVQDEWRLAPSEEWHYPDMCIKNNDNGKEKDADFIMQGGKRVWSQRIKARVYGLKLKGHTDKVISQKTKVPLGTIRRWFLSARGGDFD